MELVKLRVCVLKAAHVVYSTGNGDSTEENSNKKTNQLLIVLCGSFQTHRCVYLFNCWVTCTQYFPFYSLPPSPCLFYSLSLLPLLFPSASSPSFSSFLSFLPSFLSSFTTLLPSPSLPFSSLFYMFPLILFLISFLLLFFSPFFFLSQADLNLIFLFFCKYRICSSGKSNASLNSLIEFSSATAQTVAAETLCKRQNPPVMIRL